MKIMNREWEQIQSAQQGGPLDTPVKPTNQRKQDERYLAGDKALLRRHGLQGLRDMQYWGTIDRLERNGIVEKEGL